MLLGPFRVCAQDRLACPRTIEALPGSFSAPRTGQTSPGKEAPVCPIGCNLILLWQRNSPFLILRSNSLRPQPISHA